jgi:hypothetical protein
MIELELLFALSFGDSSRAKEKIFRPLPFKLYSPPKEEGLGVGETLLPLSFSPIANRGSIILKIFYVNF